MAKCLWQCIVFGGVSFKEIYADIGLLILRVYFGLVMAFAHGIKKLPPSEGFVEGVGAMGFPAPYFFALMAGISEFVFAILLAIGLLVRPSAFFIACTMGVAGFVYHSADPFNIKELAFIYFAIAIAFILIGSNRLSVDAFIRGKIGKGESQEEE